MNNKEIKLCPYCQSDNTLPFEEEDSGKGSDSLSFIILAAVLLIGAYFFFVISSYLFFPFVVFGLIIISSKIVNKRDRARKKADLQPKEKKYYLCLDCSSNFKA
ncbi:MAG: hypothetical protein KAT34_13560 [Candidatus Aminicenantes bacterium]|nr:hypothetical protein [Candidatus Aminicenantes bacterium]